MADTLKRPLRWVPLFGEFEITEQEVRFKGRLVSVPVTADSPGAETEEKPMFGLLLSNRTLADGDVAADVQFEDEVQTQPANCRLRTTQMLGTL